MGKVGVPPAVAYKSPLMQAGRLLYPLFHSSLRNMSYYYNSGTVTHSFL